MLRPLALALIVPLILTEAVSAQTLQPTSAGTTSAAAPKNDTLTLKERLGAKWKDEQRVDNCKVPPEKRGAKPRPNSCAHPKSQ